jgi:hypothetical protein
LNKFKEENKKRKTWQRNRKKLQGEEERKGEKTKRLNGRTSVFRDVKRISDPDSSINAEQLADTVKAE